MNKIVPHKSSALVTPDAMHLARQIKDQFAKAVDGMVDFIALGALGLQLQAQLELVRSETNSGSRGPVRGNPEATVPGWLKAHEIDYAKATLYRAIEIAENIKAEFKLGAKADLYEILKGKKPEPKQLALREKITSFVAGKSQRQLLIGIGTPDAQVGGKRDARTKPPTEAERRAAWLDDAQQRAKSTFSGLHDLEERWKTLDDAQLKVALEDARAFVREADAWLKTPTPARAGIEVEKLMQAAEAADRGGK